MLDLGKGISEYEDPETKKFIFEEPYKYQKIFKDDFHIISGRKGTGKSTIVDYQRIVAETENERVIILRPKVGDELYDTITAISRSQDRANGDQRLAISKLFEFIIYTLLMRDYIEGKEDKFLKGDLAAVYSFLANHDMIEGSVIRRSLIHLSDITEDYNHLHALFSILGKVKGTKFNTAKDCILGYLKRTNAATKLFIDDIDGIGFKYSQSTKAFLEGLVISCMNVNLTSIKEKVPFRVIITPPTELLDNAKFWNRDKIFRKTIFLRWNNLEKLRNLINKRISAELHIKKRRKRYPGDAYSVDPEKSWKRIFPDKIWNRIDSQEETLAYITRHTFYSPRTVLDICTDILFRLEESNYTIETLPNVPEAFWDATVQDACEEKSIELTRAVLDIFSQIYTNLEECISKFEGRPNIWAKREFLSFMLQTDISNVIKTTDYHEKVYGERLIQLFYTIGFLGYGFHKHTAPPAKQYYELAFSYLRWTQKRKYEMVVISPVFYDALNMQPIRGIVVIPHKDLKLSQKEVNYINSYDYRNNSFYG